jgi:hypothetical protein
MALRAFASGFLSVLAFLGSFSRRYHADATLSLSLNPIATKSMARTDMAKRGVGTSAYSAVEDLYVHERVKSILSPSPPPSPGVLHCPKCREGHARACLPKTRPLSASFLNNITDSSRQNRGVSHLELLRVFCAARLGSLCRETCFHRCLKLHYYA